MLHSRVKKDSKRQIDKSRRWVEILLDTLLPTQRFCLTLIFFEQLSIASVAEVFDTDEDEVVKMIASAIEQMRRTYFQMAGQDSSIRYFNKLVSKSSIRNYLLWEFQFVPQSSVDRVLKNVLNAVNKNE